MSAMDLTGKAICITGASSGIGRATAIACARAGMRVMCTARREERLRAVVQEIRAAGGAADHAVLDVTDGAQCEDVLQQTVERFGGIYSVFANAGYGIETAAHAMDDESLRAIFETNFWGTMNIVRPAIEIFREQGAGHALICSSCLAKLSIPYYGAYCATKAAQDHMGRSMRLELAGSGVHVSSVHPIGTKTEFFEETERRSGNLRISSATTSAFMQPPERVARAVIRCLRKPRGEVWTSVTMRTAFAISVAAPRTTDFVLGRLAARKLRNR